MGNEIRSKALEVNLAQTRDIEINIPEEHQWFIGLSSQYFGIQKRATEFFSEFHHPYSSKQVITEQLPNLVIGDFWLYQGHPERQKAFRVILDLFDRLLDSELSDDYAKQVVYTAFNFLDQVSSQQDPDHELILEGIALLKKHFNQRSFSYFTNLGFLFKSLEKAAHHPEISSDTIAFAREVALKHVLFWEETTKIEEWYQGHRKKFSGNIAGQLEKVGAPFFKDRLEQLEKAENWEELAKASFTFNDIATSFRKFTEQFQGATDKFTYLFYLLHLPGMVYQRDYLIWDLNKVIRTISTALTPEEIVKAMDELFQLFGEFRQQY
ncbi:MAG: hypothetical protein R6V49_00055, partial [Bacteroidales bacterium]